MTNISDIKKGRIPLFHRWDFYSFLILFSVFMFQISSWPRLPLFLDCYYHLSVTRGFSDAGGWVGTAFWENAPFGRPHLYPPLLHILELFIFKLGVKPIIIARLLDFFIYPIFFFIVWHILKRLKSDKFAFFGIFLLASSYTLYLAILNNIPFTLSFLLGFLSYYSIKRSKFLSAVLFLALSFYTHSLMSWLMFFSLFLSSFFDREDRRITLRVCIGAIFLALPLFFHQLRFLSFYKTFRAIEFYYAQINPLIYILAFFGFFVSVKRKEKSLYFPILYLSMAILFFSNRDRFFSGQGLIPLSFLGAVALDNIWHKVSRRASISKAVIFFCVSIFVFYCITPIIQVSFGKKTSLFFTSRLFDGEIPGRPLDSVKGETIYYPKYIDKVVTLVKENSKSDDIIFSDLSYPGGMISVLSGRATSNAMLSEVRPFKDFDEVAMARLILWFKTPGNQLPKGLTEIVDRYRLKKAGETELVYLYLNEKSNARRKIVPAKVPCGVCFGAIFLIFLVIAFDHLKEPQHKESPRANP